MQNAKIAFKTPANIFTVDKIVKRYFDLIQQIMSLKILEYCLAPSTGNHNFSEFLQIVLSKL